MRIILRCSRSSNPVGFPSLGLPERPRWTFLPIAAEAFTGSNVSECGCSKVEERRIPFSRIQVFVRDVWCVRNLCQRNRRRRSSRAEWACCHSRILGKIRSFKIPVDDSHHVFKILNPEILVPIVSVSSGSNWNCAMLMSRVTWRIIFIISKMGSTWLEGVGAGGAAWLPYHHVCVVILVEHASWWVLGRRWISWVWQVGVNWLWHEYVKVEVVILRHVWVIIVLGIIVPESVLPVVVHGQVFIVVVVVVIWLSRKHGVGLCVLLYTLDIGVRASIARPLIPTHTAQTSTSLAPPESIRFPSPSPRRGLRCHARHARRLTSCPHASYWHLLIFTQQPASEALVARSRIIASLVCPFAFFTSRDRNTRTSVPGARR